MPDPTAPTYSIVIMRAAYDANYGFAFVGGLVLLLLFSLEKFDQPYPGNRHLSKLQPSHLSNTSAYIRAFLMYFLILSLAYAAICVLVPAVPRLAQALGTPPPVGQDGNGLPLVSMAVPLAIAMAMVGLFPKLPQFGEVEARLRRLSHRAIGVPDSLADMERYVAGLKLDANRFRPEDRQSRADILALFLARQIRLAPPGARQAMQAWLDEGDLEAAMPRPTGPGLSAQDMQFLNKLDAKVSQTRAVAGKWYRVKFLMARLRELVPGHSILDGEAARRFRPLSEDLEAGYATVETSILRIREDVENLLGLLGTLDQASSAGGTLAAADLANVERHLDLVLENRLQDLAGLKEAIQDVLDKLHLLIAATVILQPAGTLHPAILAELGLVAAPAPRTNTDDALLVTAVLAVALLAFSYAWQRVAGNPDPFSVAVRSVLSTILIHGIGLTVAFMWQRARVKDGTWARPFFGGVTVPMRQYLKLAAHAYVPAFAAVLVWTLILISAPTRPEMLKGYEVATLAVAALGAAVTALFTARHLDLAQGRAVPPPEIAGLAALQGLATAFVVVLAAEAQGAGLAWDLVATGFLAGALIGAMVLLVASRSKGTAAFDAHAPDGALLPGS